ncbi:MAG: hypothetical protein LC624_04840 [Halobacteriales archaeon]|nr:hypothetical protein [Halobacteriales archaeon]
MAFASIKVREEDKRQFDRLLHEVALRTGENIAQHELFHRILENALVAKERMVAAGEARTRSWARFQFDLPEPTDAASDLDRAVYGLDR